MRAERVNSTQYISDILTIKGFNDYVTKVMYILMVMKSDDRSFWPTSREVDFTLATLLNIKLGRRDLTDKDSLDFYQANTDFIKTKTNITSYIDKLSKKNLIKYEDGSYYLSPVLENCIDSVGNEIKISVRWEQQ